MLIHFLSIVIQFILFFLIFIRLSRRCVALQSCDRYTEADNNKSIYTAVALQKDTDFSYRISLISSRLCTKWNNEIMYVKKKKCI